MMRFVALVTALATASFSGCGGETTSGPDGVNSLVSTTTEPAGANCANGGVRFDFGPDINADGVQDADEIVDTQYSCGEGKGTDGEDFSTLVSTTAEPAGENCAEGGQRVDFGIDDNLDGVLDAVEIDGTSFVCNGATGDNGLTSLVATSVEAPGANCAAGGVRIDGGFDASSDGVLDSGEITSTNFACNSLNSLVVASVVAPGGVCGAVAGNQIDMGLDLDDDGALQAGEITATALACNGADGADGANGLDGLVNQTTILAGGACGAATGVQVDTGLDTDRSGALEAGEVLNSTLICNAANGADGAPGNNGPVSLVILTPEPAGANCAEGGTQVESGVDADASGGLEGGEITATVFACNAFFIGENALENGSFETGDFTGWTIVQPTNSNEVHAIVGDGVTVNQSDSLFDFFSGTPEGVAWCSVPPVSNTYLTSDGVQSAVLFAETPGSMRLFQDVFIPPGATTLSWDMRWHNTDGAWAPGLGTGENLQVHVRNPADDSILATVFETADPLPVVSPDLVNFTADVSAFSGQTVRIDFFPNTFNLCQWFQFDNIVLN